jgi:hypothetical protein
MRIVINRVFSEETGVSSEETGVFSEETGVFSEETGVFSEETRNNDFCQKFQYTYL